MKNNDYSVELTTNIDLNTSDAFDRFTVKMKEWWPSEYSWSGGALVNITLEPKVDGLGTETGPNGFRYDFARVTSSLVRIVGTGS